MVPEEVKASTEPRLAAAHRARRNGCSAAWRLAAPGARAKLGPDIHGPRCRRRGRALPLAPRASAPSLRSPLSLRTSEFLTHLASVLFLSKPVEPSHGVDGKNGFDNNPVITIMSREFLSAASSISYVQFQQHCRRRIAAQSLPAPDVRVARDVQSLEDLGPLGGRLDRQLFLQRCVVELHQALRHEDKSRGQRTAPIHRGHARQMVVIGMTLPNNERLVWHCDYHAATLKSAIPYYQTCCFLRHVVSLHMESRWYGERSRGQEGRKPPQAAGSQVTSRAPCLLISKRIFLASF